MTIDSYLHNNNGISELCLNLVEMMVFIFYMNSIRYILRTTIFQLVTTCLHPDFEETMCPQVCVVLSPCLVSLPMLPRGTSMICVSGFIKVKRTSYLDSILEYLKSSLKRNAYVTIKLLQYSISPLPQKSQSQQKNNEEAAKCHHCTSKNIAVKMTFPRKDTDTFLEKTNFLGHLYTRKPPVRTI